MNKQIIKKLRILIFFVLCSLFFATPAFAAVPAGILKDQMWFSKDPFFADDTITIFTLVYNSSDYRLSGTMQLRDGTTTIDKKTFTVLPSGGSEVISFPWKVTAGNHAFSAVISEDQLDKISGGVVESPITTMQTISLKRFADLDTDHDGVGNMTDTDDDGDGVSDIQEKKTGTNPLRSDTDEDGILDGADPHPLVKDIPPKVTLPALLPDPIASLERAITANIPEPIAAHAVPALGSIEDFRISQAKRANTYVVSAAKKIVTADNVVGASSAKNPAWQIFQNGVKSGEAIKTPFGYAKLFFTLVWQFLTTNVYAFYILILLAGFITLRSLFRLFF